MINQLSKRALLFLSLTLPLALSSKAETAPSAWDLYQIPANADRQLFFATDAIGKKLPILWGFDTAWNDYANMLRGVRYTGSDIIGVARVSFQPWAQITQKGVLPESLQKNLDKRLETVGLIGKKVDIALNLDGGEPTIKEIYGGLDADNNYIGDPESVADNYALLIDATAQAVTKAGYKVVSAAPFNEPDYFWNGTPIEVFDKINRRLKDLDTYPLFRDIRISGGNTLNCDEALPWYDKLKEHLDEGNTHQLAGDFDHYADFFARVRADGKYATADELHNVMEAMVGVEYGMQTGIWWGTAEHARGEFCKASFGERLGYAENRYAWSAASVYRAPSENVQAFLGCSERQARPSSFHFVSLSGDIFVNGKGPLREYTAFLPGDPQGGYQTELQRNAETVLEISQGEDIAPEIDGTYTIVNAASHLAVGGENGTTANMTNIVQSAYVAHPSQQWDVTPVPMTQGGDFSYFFIKNSSDGQALDNCNWNLEPGGKVIAYGASDAAVQQWALEYDGDGFFHIRNKHSALYLEPSGGTDGAQLVQNPRSDAPTQKWRFIPKRESVEFRDIDTPTGLKASSGTASVALSWDAVEGLKYNVLRAGKGSEKFNTIARGLGNGSFIDNTIEAGETYLYKILAEDASGNRSSACEPIEVAATGKETLLARCMLDGSLDCKSEDAFSLKLNGQEAYADGRTEGSRALTLRQSRWLQLPYSILGSDGFTIGMWVRNYVSNDGTQLFSTGHGEDDCLYFSPNEGGVARLVATSRGNRAEIACDSKLENEWTHVAITSDEDEVSLYIDGKMVGGGPSREMAEMIPANRLLTYIGKPQHTLNSRTTFYLSDIQVYNHSLSPSEITKLLQGETAGLDGIAVEKEIISKEYFTLGGIRIDNPEAKGLMLVRTTYSDGTTTISKILR